MFNTKNYSYEEEFHESFDGFVKVGEDLALVLTEADFLCLFEELSVLLEFSLWQILGPVNQFGFRKSLIHDLGVIDPDKVGNCEKLAWDFRNQFLANFIEEFSQFLFVFEVNFEFLLLTFLNLTIFRFQNFFTWWERTHLVLEDFFLELLFQNFFRAWWNGFHEILKFFVESFEVFIVEVALEAALEGVQAGLLWSWAGVEQIFAWSLSANEVWVLGIGLREVLSFIAEILLEGVVLEDIYVGKVKEGGGHCLACLLIYLKNYIITRTWIE